jgi:hypothetical protein
MLVHKPFSAVLAGIIVEMWKGEFGLFKRLLKDDEKENLKILARKEPKFKRDMEALLPFYFAKETGKGISNQQVADQLYRDIRGGMSFVEHARRNPDVIDHMLRADLLIHAAQVCRGIVITEIKRSDHDASSVQYRLDRTGLPLSGHLAFGETIPLFDAEDLGLGQNWLSTLQKKVATTRLYPESWPSDVRFYGRSPKILVLDEGILHRMRDAFADQIVTEIHGIISINSGMTSHVAVLSRSLGIGAISCPLIERERASAKFALIQAGQLRLYMDVPDLLTDDFASLLADMQCMKPTGD